MPISLQSMAVRTKLVAKDLCNEERRKRMSSEKCDPGLVLIMRTVYKPQLSIM